MRDFVRNFVTHLLVSKAMVLASISIVWAESIEIEVDRVYSGKHVRVEGYDGVKPKFLVTIDVQSKTGTVYLQAAALQSNRFPSKKEAPWLHLEFFDEKGEILARKNNVLIATVEKCGGYENHTKTFAMKYPKKDLESIVSGKAKLGGSKPIHC